jgi:hypothetical protein
MNAHIIALVDLELMAARRKFPSWPDSVVKQAAIVCEESGETIRAALMYEDEHGPIGAVYKEAIQTIAMCVRLIDEGSAKLRS